MMFQDKYFAKFDFTKEQIDNNLQNAIRDLHIAEKDEFLDVKFNYAYTALLKAGIALLSFHQRKIRSVPGHHVKVIDKLADLLGDQDVADLGNVMRSKRNINLYDGGIEVTVKECDEYLSFVGGVVRNVKKIIEE